MDKVAKIESGGAQFTPGPCTCEIVMRTGETLDSSLGDRLCSDISRIQLCPKHSAAPAMYEALQAVLYGLENGDDYEGLVPGIKCALAQAEGRQV